MSSVPASAYLTLAIILFCIGLFGALTKRNTVIVLVCIELMLNAANLNLVAFSKLGLFPNLTGQIFSLFTMAVAAAEAAVGLAILIALYRNRTTVQVDEMDTLKDSIVTEKGEGNNDRLCMAHTAFPLVSFCYLLYSGRKLERKQCT